MLISVAEESLVQHLQDGVSSIADTWVKTGGPPINGDADDYRQCKNGMISSTDIIERKELKQLKVCRENSIF